jgi:hypothetical protein
MNDLMLSFAEARELIDDAKESQGTAYFSDDAKDAENKTTETIAMWNQLCDDLAASNQCDELEKLKREYNVKFRQLGAELEELLDKAEE